MYEHVNLFNLKGETENYSYDVCEGRNTVKLSFMCSKGSGHVSKILLTPFPCSLSNDPINLFRPLLQPIFVHLHNCLRGVGVCIRAFGTKEG